MNHRETQECSGDFPTAAGTYVATNLCAATISLLSRDEDEFALNGVTKVQGIRHVEFLADCLPESLESLSFHSSFNDALHGLTLPSQLQHLTLGTSFDQSLDGVNWPSLHSLTLGDRFDQSLKRVSFPSSLRHLTFGYRFNQPLKGVIEKSLPNLHSLTLGVSLVTWQ